MSTDELCNCGHALALQREVNAWRELGDEMWRVVDFMTQEQRDDLLPDWFLLQLLKVRRGEKGAADGGE